MMMVVMMVRGRVRWTMVMVVVRGAVMMMVRVWWRTMMVMMMMMVFGSSPFAMIWASLIALTPRASTLSRWSVSSAVSWVALAILGGNSKMAAFVMVSVCWMWSWRSRRSQIIGIRSLCLAFAGSVLSAVAPGAAALSGRTMRPEAASVPAALALV